jgi:hypothetical protein
MKCGLVIASAAVIGAMIFPLPAAAVPVIYCSLFASERRWTGRWVALTAALLFVDLMTGRMPGVLSLSFVIVAGCALWAGRILAWPRSGAVGAVIVASVMSFAMTAIGVVQAAFLYGRGQFTARILAAFGPSAWWAVPLACSVVIVIMYFPWRGGTEHPGME